jgi:DnaK suppressor protein
MTKHFDDSFLASQKNKLLSLKSELLNNLRPLDDFQVSADEVVEDGDQAQTYINQNLAFGLKQRELDRLKEIELALYKINAGTYGMCEDTDEPIERKRLEKMPWTTLSIVAAEEREREDGQFKVG